MKSFLRKEIFCDFKDVRTILTRLKINILVTNYIFFENCIYVLFKIVCKINIRKR